MIQSRAWRRTVRQSHVKSAKEKTEKAAQEKRNDGRKR